jgi:hypothetical protein
LAPICSNSRLGVGVIASRTLQARIPDRWGGPGH